MDASTVDTGLTVLIFVAVLRELRANRTEVGQTLRNMLVLMCLPASQRGPALAELEAAELRGGGRHRRGRVTPSGILGMNGERAHEEGHLVERGSESSEDALRSEDQGRTTGVTGELHRAPIGRGPTPVSTNLSAPPEPPLTARGRHR